MRSGLREVGGAQDEFLSKLDSVGGFS